MKPLIALALALALVLGVAHPVYADEPPTTVFNLTDGQTVPRGEPIEVGIRAYDVDPYGGITSTVTLNGEFFLSIENANGGGGATIWFVPHANRKSYTFTATTTDAAGNTSVTTIQVVSG